MNGSTRRVDSYTRGVAPRKNNVWTEDNLNRVYTLRLKGDTPQEIADWFGVSKVEVHNATRRAKALLAGKCVCGEYLTPQEVLDNEHRIAKLCTKCKKAQMEYKHQLREDALAAGKCGYCQDADVLPGKCACKKCLSATHRRRNLDGLCGKCGARPIRAGGKALCDVCAAEMRTTAIEARMQ